MRGDDQHILWICRAGLFGDHVVEFALNRRVQTKSRQRFDEVFARFLIALIAGRTRKKSSARSLVVKHSTVITQTHAFDSVLRIRVELLGDEVDDVLNVRVRSAAHAAEQCDAPKGLLNCKEYAHFASKRYEN